MPYETPWQQDAQRGTEPENKQAAIASSESESHRNRVIIASSESKSRHNRVAIAP